MNLNKGLLKLSDRELRWLKGRLSTIDVQKGCPHQCITCAVDAPKYAGSMSWYDFMTLSDSIVEIKEKKKISLWTNDVKHNNISCIDAFWASDPMFYRSMDGNTERTIYDVIMNFHVNHSKASLLTTAGWSSGSNYMQRAAEKIVSAYDDNNFNMWITYSIKTCAPQAMKEYDSYAESSYDSMNQMFNFFRNSKFMSNVTLNLKTLMSINEKRKKKEVFPSFQYISDSDMKEESYQDEYGKYNFLFSLGFIESVETYLKNQNVLTESSDSHFRDFGGIGRALDLGFTKSLTLSDYELRISQNSADQIHKKQYSAMINGNGVLNIYYGDPEALGKVLVPKEHFEILADKSYWSWNRKQYTMLANLQGRRLLD